MKRSVTFWSVQRLMDNEYRLNLPGRNGPHMWSAHAENGIVDSIIKNLDIGTLYFYLHKDGTYECLDGRSRIMSIRNFMRGDRIFLGGGDRWLSRKTYKQIRHDRSEVAVEFRHKLEQYHITVVCFSGVDQQNGEVLDEQLMRLGIGFLPIQKVAYMVGDARDECFWKLDRHPYLAAVDTSVEPLMRGYVAGQILRQAFFMDQTGTHGPIRHTDVMKFFKHNAQFDDNDRRICDKAHHIMDVLADNFQEGEFGNPALLVSLFLFAWRHDVKCDDKARYTVNFIRDVMYRTNNNLLHSIPVADNYNSMLEFVHNLSYVSGRSENISGRAHCLDLLFDRFMRLGEARQNMEKDDGQNGLESRRS